MKARFVSLDILRGLTIGLMITVNTPGSWSYVYAPFLHAPWHGCTLTDLVFPFFLFIVGGAMVFSFKKHNYTINSALIQKVLKRTFIIFLIGLLLNAYPFIGRDYERLRIMGVLQRIGLSYGLGALFILMIKDNKQLIIYSIFILIGYWAILYFGVSIAPYGLETNIGRKIDLLILGDAHMWHGKKIAFDPEGLLSTIPSMISVIGGYLSVRWIVDHKVNWRNIILLGIGLLAVARLWGEVFPINKSLWTSSYVLLSVGWAIICLGIIEVLMNKSWFRKGSFPLKVLGSNPLFIFVLSILVVKTYFKIHIISNDGTTRNMYSYIYHDLMIPVFGQMNGSLIFALSHLLIFYIIALWMYKKNIFVKI